MNERARARKSTHHAMCLCHCPHYCRWFVWLVCSRKIYQNLHTIIVLHMEYFEARISRCCCLCRRPRRRRWGSSYSNHKAHTRSPYVYSRQIHNIHTNHNGTMLWLLCSIVASHQMGFLVGKRTIIPIKWCHTVFFHRMNALHYTIWTRRVKHTDFKRPIHYYDRKTIKTKQNKTKRKRREEKKKLIKSFFPICLFHSVAYFLMNRNSFHVAQ